MVSTSELVEATKRVKVSSASHVGWPLAAIKAINSKGITHKPDVKRLTKEIMREIRPKRSQSSI